MRFLLLLIMSVQGDVDMARIEFADSGQCEKAKREIVESMAKQQEVTLHGAYCLEVRY